MKRMVIVCLLGVAALAFAQVQKGKTQPLLTKQWMRGVNGPHCSALNNLLKEPGPADEKAWEMAAQHAAILNESSHVLMADGRCPDGTWAQAAKQLRQSSGAVIKAVEGRNAAEARSAFAGVLESCKTCHAAHKKPSQAPRTE
jgi:hypothetical protein